MEFNTHVTAHKDDTYALAINVDYGFFTPGDFVKIAELANKYGVTKMMATTAKKISFYDVPAENVNPLWDDLKATFGARLRTPQGKIIVCPGKGHCKFAMPGFDGHAMLTKSPKSAKHTRPAKSKSAFPPAHAAAPWHKYVTSVFTPQARVGL